MTLTRTAAAVLALAIAAPAAAQPAEPEPMSVALPLEAPAEAHPMVADFVAICSRALTDLGSGVREGTARGYADTTGAGWLAAGLAGFAVLAKDGAYLTVRRVAFPHVVSVSCEFLIVDAIPDGFDAELFGAIPGVEGGIVAFGSERLGRWSLLDSDGEIVVVTETRLPRGGLTLGMGRSVRTALGRGKRERIDLN